jgi:hypothetical protein
LPQKESIGKQALLAVSTRTRGRVSRIRLRMLRAFTDRDLQVCLPPQSVHPLHGDNIVVTLTYDTPVFYLRVVTLSVQHLHEAAGGEQVGETVSLANAPAPVRKCALEMLGAGCSIAAVREVMRAKGVEDSYDAYYNARRKITSDRNKEWARQSNVTFDGDGGPLDLLRGGFGDMGVVFAALICDVRITSCLRFADCLTALLQ